MAQSAHGFTVRYSYSGSPPIVLILAIQQPEASARHLSTPPVTQTG